MKIELYASGISNNDEISPSAGCGVVLFAIDDYKRIQCREMSFVLDNSPQLLADVQATRLALSSIIPSMRKHSCLLFINNQNVADFLTSSIIVKEIEDQIFELKRWYGYYNDISINLLSTTNQHFESSKNLAKLALESQKPFDSGTYVL